MATPIPHNEASFSLERLVEITGGTLRARGPRDEVRGVVIDSRAVEPGCLFVALRGTRHDAHRFVPDAVRAGAAAVVVDRLAALPESLDAAVVEVEDTTRALGDIASAHRAAWEGTVVAVTGSAGKTTTKELTAAALDATGARVHRTRGNLNNLYGVPMTLLELSPAHDVAVVELGTNRPGEIARLAAIARPDVGIVTLVAAAHTEGLGSVEDVAREKWALVEGLPAGGVAVVNGDDVSLRALGASEGGPRRIWFGHESGEDVILLGHDVDDELRTRARYALAGRAGEVEVRLQLLGEAAALDAAAALGAVLATGRDPESAAEGLASVAPGSGRMRPRRAANGALVLDDSYNANPRSVALALDTGARLAEARGGRLVAILGDMKELGDRSADEHAAVGRAAAAAEVSLLVLCGPEMRHAAAAARRASGTMEVHQYDDALDAVDRVADESERRDVILVKGSRSMAMERVVDALSVAEGTT